MVLVTGAAGKTGQAIIRALHERETAVRALVHKESQIQIVQDLNVQDIIVGDMGSLDTMTQASEGVKSIYHICPNVNPKELDIGRVIIQAAQSNRVEQLVYHSVFHSQIEAMPHHWQKMRVEEQLFASGLSYTILQPAPYMQNILAYWPEIVQKRKYFLPYSKNTRLGCVDLEDVAEAAAIVLSEPGYEGGIYELCGVSSLSQSEMAQILSQHLASKVEVDAISVEEWEANARSRGLVEYQIQTLAQMFRYYEHFGYIGNVRILAWLLNREPTSFATFVERTINNLVAR